MKKSAFNDVVVRVHGFTTSEYRIHELHSTTHADLVSSGGKICRFSLSDGRASNGKAICQSDLLRLREIAARAVANG